MPGHLTRPGLTPAHPTVLHQLTHATPTHIGATILDPASALHAVATQHISPAPCFLPAQGTEDGIDEEESLSPTNLTESKSQPTRIKSRFGDGRGLESMRPTFRPSFPYIKTLSTPPRSLFSPPPL
jgi:hypothetical protein